MAALPRPIGIDRTLTDIATAIGNSARLLPTLSRSEIGAVAVKAAKVRVEFQMARAFEKSSDGVELGVKTFSISAAQVSQTSSARAMNNGVIELEIVAVALAEVTEPVPADSGPRPDKPREAIVRAIALLKLPEASSTLGAADKKIFNVLLKQAEAALADGELDLAANVLAEIQMLLEQAPKPAAAAPQRATRVVKKAPPKPPAKKG